MGMPALPAVVCGGVCLINARIFYSLPLCTHSVPIHPYLVASHAHHRRHQLHHLFPIFLLEWGSLRGVRRPHNKGPLATRNLTPSAEGEFLPRLAGFGPLNKIMFLYKAMYIGTSIFYLIPTAVLVYKPVSSF